MPGLSPFSQLFSHWFLKAWRRRDKLGEVVLINGFPASKGGDFRHRGATFHPGNFDIPSPVMRHHATSALVTSPLPHFKSAPNPFGLLAGMRLQAEHVWELHRLGTTCITPPVAQDIRQRHCSGGRGTLGKCSPRWIVMRIEDVRKNFSGEIVIGRGLMMI
jgi:hypothetical protein